MSIPSLYGSGDDEAKLFRLLDPSEHPSSGDEGVAGWEEESLASGHYDEAQEGFDELAEPTPLGVELRELSDEEKAEVAQLIEDIKNRRE